MKLSGKVGSWRVDKIYLFLICTSCMIRLIVCYFNTMLPLATRIAGRECYQIGARGDGAKRWHKMGDQSPALPPRAVIVCSTLPSVGVVVVLVVVETGPVVVVVVMLLLYCCCFCLCCCACSACCSLSLLFTRKREKTQSETIIKMYKDKKYFSNRAASAPTCFGLV